MPNWCSNNLTITGKVEDVKAMFKAAKVNARGEYTLESFIPMPRTYYNIDTTNSVGCFVNDSIRAYKDMHGVIDEATELRIKQDCEKRYKAAVKYQTKKYGCVGWYNWRVVNLGCKWDSTICTKGFLNNLIESETRNGETRITLVFDTPWSPPVEWLVVICERNPNLVFELWCDEESGYKFAFEGSEGELGENFADELRAKYYQEALKTDPDDICDMCHITDDYAIAAIHNSKIFPMLLERAFDWGYWGRDGYLEGFEEFVEGCCFDEVLRDYATSTTKHHIKIKPELWCFGNMNKDDVYDLLVEYLEVDDNVHKGVADENWIEGFVNWYTTEKK